MIWYNMKEDIKYVTTENKAKRICETATQLCSNSELSCLQVVASYTKMVFTDVLSQLHLCHPLLHPAPLLPLAVPKHGQTL